MKNMDIVTSEKAIVQSMLLSHEGLAFVLHIIETFDAYIIQRYEKYF